MQGIVSTLDEAHNAKIEALWNELEREFGLKYACVAYPHFSYQVVESYDTARAEAALRALAQEAQSFPVTTTGGLGIFTGEKPVLYVGIVRDARLTAFHDRVVAAVAPFAHGIHTAHFDHSQWVPHITLAMGDLTHDMLPEVVRLLSQRSFDWDITVNDVGLVLDARGTRDDWVCMTFGESEACASV